MSKIFLLIPIVISASFAAYAQAVPQAVTNNNTIERVKTEVHRLGLGPKAKAVVKTRDGKSAKGYVSEMGDDTFQLTIDKSGGQALTFAFRDVLRVRKPGLSTAAKIAIVAGIATAVVVLVAAIVVKDALDNGCFLGCAP